MRNLVLLALVIAVCGCSQLKTDASDIRADNAALSAAARKIIVIRGTQIPGHPDYSVLGPAQGYCEKDPHGDTQAIPGDSMKLAAYREYGGRVDAIIGAHAWYMDVGDQTSSVYEPHSHTGYWECAGTAVRFTAATQLQ